MLKNISLYITSPAHHLILTNISHAHTSMKLKDCMWEYLEKEGQSPLLYLQKVLSIVK